MLSEFLQYLNSNLTPGQYGSVPWMVIYILIIFAVVSLAVMSMIWFERKALAKFQIRLGPMRVGPHGLLQPIADSLKLLTKEDIIPAGADKVIFWLAPVIVDITALTVFIVIPFGPKHAVTDINIGILFLLGVSSLSVLGIIMAGWASNSHYPLLGALRSSAQMVSYEVAMGLAVVAAVLLTSFTPGWGGAGTLSLIKIVQAQEAQHTWFIFKFFPLGLISFVMFAIAMIAETNRAPFDLPEAESELVAGFHTEYSGLRWSLFMLAEYAAMFVVSSVAVALWLGGWMRPFPHWLAGPTWDTIFSFFPAITLFILAAFAFMGTIRMPKHPALRIQTIGLGVFAAILGLIGLVLLIPVVRWWIMDIYWFAIKVAVFVYLYIWYRGTFPRYRFDQLMKVGWKVLLPTALAVVIAISVIGLRQELYSWISGVL